MGQLIAMCSALCYALSYIFIRKGQSASEPPDGGLLPVLVISVLALDSVFLWLFLVDGSPVEWSHEALLPLVFAGLSGVIGTLVGRLALYRAIHLLGATRGVVVKGLAPIVTVLIVSFMAETPVAFGDWIGLFCLFVAVVLLFCERKFDNPPMRAFTFFRNGIAIAGFAALAQGVGHAFRQLSIEGDLSAMTAASVDVTAALVGYIIALSFTGKLSGYFHTYRKYMNWSLTLAGLCSALGVLLFFAAIEWISVSTVSILVATEPLMVAILSAIYFPKLERITWWSAVAAVIVAGGVIFIHVA